MDTFFLRQQMLAKLEEFRLFHRLYQENINPQLQFMREHLDPDHRRDLEQFLIERADLDQWSIDMDHEINVRTRVLHGYYQHVMEAFKEEEKKDGESNSMVLTHNKVTVRRHKLPHGSVVLSLGYNTAERVLDVEYQNKKVYRYYDVPKAVANAISEDQAGSSVNKMVKGKYKFECILE